MRRLGLRSTICNEVSAIDDLYVRIGERIRLAREERGWTQTQLGEAVGFAQATVAHYELGRRHIKLDDLYRIASALNKPYAYFVGIDKQVEEEARLNLERQLRKDVADFVGVRMLPVLTEPVPMDQLLTEGHIETMMPVARELAAQADCVLVLKGKVAEPIPNRGDYLFLSRQAPRLPGRVYLATIGSVVTFVSLEDSGQYSPVFGPALPGQVVLIGEFCGLHTQTLQVQGAPPRKEGSIPLWESLNPEAQAQLRQFAEFLLLKRNGSNKKTVG